MQALLLELVSPCKPLPVSNEYELRDHLVASCLTFQASDRGVAIRIATHRAASGRHGYQHVSRWLRCSSLKNSYLPPSHTRLVPSRLAVRWPAPRVQSSSPPISKKILRCMSPYGVHLPFRDVCRYARVGLLAATTTCTVQSIGSFAGGRLRLGRSHRVLLSGYCVVLLLQQDEHTISCKMPGKSACGAYHCNHNQTGQAMLRHTIERTYLNSLFFQ